MTTEPNPTTSEDSTAPDRPGRRAFLGRLSGLGALAGVVAVRPPGTTPTPPTTAGPAPTPTTAPPSTTTVPTTTPSSTTTTVRTSPPTSTAPSTSTSTTTTTAPAGSADGGLSLHVARRCSFGPTPELLAEIRAVGTTAWIDAQLAWSKIDDSATDAIVASWPRVGQTAAEIAANGQAGAVRYDLGGATAARAVFGRRHLHEVLVDFWWNHFNVDITNTLVGPHCPTHDRTVIRPLATARFADLLVAVAKSPAMLLYLDQALSRADGGRLPIENYAREMLELHTVGVDGGYDETDVKEVASLLSGWSLTDRVGTFTFRAAWHSPGPLAQGGDVLGWRLGGLSGVAAGESLLVHLARHPKTAARLAHKLAVRFVGEHVLRTDPVVTDAAAVYLANDTAIAPTLRSILTSTAFRQSAGRRLRRPFDLYGATLRALRLQWDPSRAPDLASFTASQLAQLDQVLHSCPTPDGHSDSDAAWNGAGSMIYRWNFATRAGSGLGMPAPIFDPARIVGTPTPATVGDAFDRIAVSILGEPLEATARTAILTATGLTPTTRWNPAWSRSAIALVLQSPQHQVR